jgi:hypothetical protein
VITWHPGGRAEPDLVANDVVNWAFAVALHAAGIHSLHGSAVAIDGAAIAFVADSGTGKSTLAAALVAAGAYLASDDLVAAEVCADGTVLVRPGVPQLRLRDDAVGHVARPALAHDVDEFRAADGKRVLTGLPAERVQRASLPLRAIYVLTRGSAAQASAAERERIGVTAAALALVRHAKLAPLLGGDELPVVLDRTAELARRVPIYSLRLARDITRLGEGVEQILEWHEEAHVRLG